MKKRIFLTGGSGFIGKNILEQLSEKYEISAPGHSELDLLDYSAVENFLKRKDFDVVIHTANIGGMRNDPGPEDSTELNLRMFFNLTRCRDRFGRMIHLGSGSEYGKQEPIVNANEDDFGKRVPVDSYGFYKYACSRYIGGVDWITCLRLFGCYGKYEDYELKFVSNAICRSLFGMPIRINNKNVSFSYLYVDDFIRILEYFIANKGKHKIYNAVPNESVDLLTISRLVRDLSGGKTEIEVANPGMGHEYTGSNKKLREDLKGFKFTKIKDGVAKLYKWYEENRKTIREETLDFAE